MKNWDEVRTAFQVARQGTVSGAAEVLGVHHATVIRHIDALEAQLGVKLFQRHARGYTATEAGEDLMRVAQTTDDQFGQLEGRIKGRGADVSGELVVTALGGFAPLVAPILADFQAAHPGLLVRFLTGDRVFRLEYGEAHVAIRAGDGEVQPDNVVQKLAQLPAGLYGADSYIAQHGAPKDEADLVNHRFAGHDNPDSRAPFYRWLKNPRAAGKRRVPLNVGSGDCGGYSVWGWAGVPAGLGCGGNRADAAGDGPQAGMGHQCALDHPRRFAPHH